MVKQRGQGWLLQPCPSPRLQPSRAASGAGPIYQRPGTRQAGRGKLRAEFPQGLSLHA